MNLLHELSRAGATWSLQNDVQPVFPDAPDDTRRAHTLLLTVRLTAEAAPLQQHFNVHTELTVEQMVAALLKKQARDHALLRAWLDSKGNVPVALDIPPEAFEYIGEPMHTALRKLADSKASVVTWNSLHHMHSDDRVALWVAAGEVVKKAFVDGKVPSRRNLAAALKERLLAVLDERRFAQLQDDAGRAVKRLPAEDYALLMMQTGCELTDIDEWMWGWLGYVVKDAEA